MPHSRVAPAWEEFLQGNCVAPASPVYKGGKNMGCVLCNLTRVNYFGTDKKPEYNPFYCPNREEEDEFLEELASDIATRHPEFIERINKYVVVKPSI